MSAESVFSGEDPVSKVHLQNAFVSFHCRFGLGGATPSVKDRRNLSIDPHL